MKKCFILILCSVASLLAKAQMASNSSGASPGVPTFVSNGFQGAGINTYTDFPRSASAPNFDGYGTSSESESSTRFFVSSAFQKGELRTRKVLSTTELSYRFDQVEGTIEVKKRDGSTMYLNEKDILYCKLFFDDNIQVVFMPVALPNETKLTLLQVVYKTPTLQLYRNIRKKVVTKNGYATNDIENDYHYYVRKGDKNLLQEVDITAKSFTQALPEKEKTITRLFKEAKSKGDLTVSDICKMMGKLDKKAEIE